MRGAHPYATSLGRGWRRPPDDLVGWLRGREHARSCESYRLRRAGREQHAAERRGIWTLGGVEIEAGLDRCHQRRRDAGRERSECERPECEQLDLVITARFRIRQDTGESAEADGG